MPLRLLYRNLMAHKLRTFLTLASLAVAFFLLCLLRSIVVSLDAAAAETASRRLVVQSDVSLFVDLPLSYQAKIAGVPGVESVANLTWFGGEYEETIFAQFACDQDILLDTYPEFELIAGSEEAFVEDRRACIIGKNLAKKYDLQLGQRIPIEGKIFPLRGGAPWEFTVAGIYDTDSPNIDKSSLFFHYKYLEESLNSGAADGPEPGAGVYVVLVKQGADLLQVAQAIDALFYDGPLRVRTATEAEFQRQFITMFGNVTLLLGSIGGAVVFAISLAVLNTMLLAARERTTDLGILKALGFTDRTAFLLLLVESLLICAVGGGAGILLAVLLEGSFNFLFDGAIPGYSVRPETIALAAAATLTIGLLAAAVPGWRAARLRPVDAFRAEG